MPSSSPSPPINLDDIFRRFRVVPHCCESASSGSASTFTFVSAEPYGSGHINDTYRVRVKVERPHLTSSSAAAVENGDDNENENGDDEHVEAHQYILQRINHQVFTKPVEVMDNVVRVTRHLSRKVRERGGDPAREALTLLPTAASDDAEPKAEPNKYYALVDGNYWRAYHFVDGATTYEIGESGGGGGDSNSHVREAAAAFARFQRDVSDLPPPRLHETIPGFGDTEHRFRQFEAALDADVKGRAAGCRTEIDFCLERRGDASILTDLLRSGAIPERVAHYDTKINNVLIDDETGKGVCVIDLDTVMPGLAIYDFGDAVRAATALAAEDETDLAKVGFSMDKFELLAEGYLSVGGEFLTDVEVDHLAFAARLVTFTIGLRFLADHLAGDVYFKVQRENHNLDRARTQLKTVADMEDRFDEMKAVVEKYRRKRR